MFFVSDYLPNKRDHTKSSSIMGMLLVSMQTPLESFLGTRAEEYGHAEFDA
jgi:hypothetical protein